MTRELVLGLNQITFLITQCKLRFLFISVRK